MTEETLPEGRKPLPDDWLQSKAQDFSKVTRLEIITKDGRVFSKHNINSVQMQLQDGARTLKLFISEEDTSV
jgi:hypothetical protein